MLALIWMLSALSAALFLIAFFWAWRGRYLLLLQGGSSLGQAAWQAVTTSPSRISRPSSLASMRAALMRCVQ